MSRRPYRHRRAQSAPHARLYRDPQDWALYWQAWAQWRAAKHPQWRSACYRLPEEGVLAGVCAGLARYGNTSVALIRIFAVLLTLVSGLLPGVIAYFVLALVLRPAPDQPHALAGMRSLRDNLSLLENAMEDNEQRLRAVERYITSETFALRDRFNHLS